MSEAVPSFAREATGLTRSISIPVMFMYQLSGLPPCFMLIFTYTDIAYAYPGANMLWTFLIVGALTIPTIGIAMTFMAMTMPRSGGEYNWMTRTFHPAIGFAAAVQFLMAQPATVAMFNAMLSNFILVTTFGAIGMMTSNPALLELSSTFIQPHFIFLISSVLMIIITLVMIAPLKVFAVYQYVGFIASMLGVAIFFALLGMSTPATFAEGFNRFSSISFNQIVPTAVSQGASIPAGFALGATFLAMPYVMWWATTYWNVYPAGEARNPTRSMPIAGLGAMILYYALMVIGGLLFFNAIPYDFTYAMTWLARQAPSVYPLPGALYPAPQALAVFLTNNVTIVTIMLILWFIGFLYVYPGWWMVFSRSILAYSFDRILPEKFSEISERLHTPIWAVVLNTVLSFIFTWWCVYGPYWWAVTHYVLWGCSVGFIFAMFAAAVFPYKKKEWFKAAPKVVQAKIAGIPIVTIAGVLGGIILIGQVVVTFIVDIAMPEGQFGILLEVLTWIAAFAIYYASRYYHKARGIDITRAFKYIPPE